MKYFRYAAIFFLVILATVPLLSCAIRTNPYCLTGAFLGDKPSRKDIAEFQDKYGKKPFFIMVFVDWGHFVDKEIIKDVYSEGSQLIITWEPWYAKEKKGIDYEAMLSGKYDEYIEKFCDRIKTVKEAVLIRFAHEMNGNWYPWSGSIIGKEKYKKIYQYVKDVFDKKGTANIKWIFSVNAADVPSDESNKFMLYYPGDAYVDYIGIDGYNWGNTKSWSRWMSFREIFDKRYNEVIANTKKPVLISEFSSTSSGGNKTRWIKEAMNDIKQMKKIEGFILFNVNKETNWSFPADKDSGKEFKKQLKDGYFKEV
ncbi:MAG: hypothetical protein HQ579_08075 [Candidatus Omnitrophica bacterium]|nr:hypothetical protein [Candidatus Omnitrophota bacterium]